VTPPTMDAGTIRDELGDVAGRLRSIAYGLDELFFERIVRADDQEVQGAQPLDLFEILLDAIRREADRVASLGEAVHPLNKPTGVQP